MSIAITDAITTLAEAERRFHLQRTEDESFFPEWDSNLPDLSDSDKTAIQNLRRRYLYHRSDRELDRVVQILKQIGWIARTDH